MGRNFIIFIFLILLISSCKTSRILPSRKIPTTEKSEELVSALPTKRNFNNTVKFKRSQVLFTLNGKEETVKASIAIYRDSFMLISVIPIAGIEVLRIYFTPDSLLLLNRSEKSYTKSTLAKFTGKYGVVADFNDIQSIFTNEFFLYGKETDATFDNPDESLSEGYRMLDYYSRHAGVDKIRQSFFYQDEAKQLEKIMINDFIRKIQLSITYSDFQEYESYQLPGNISIYINEYRNRLGMKLEIQNVELNQEISGRPDIPDNYIEIVI